MIVYDIITVFGRQKFSELIPYIFATIIQTKATSKSIVNAALLGIYTQT